MTEVLTEHDLRMVIDVIEEGRHGDPNAPLPWVLMRGLAQLVPCDRMNFPYLDVAHRQPLAAQSLHGEEERLQDGSHATMDDHWWRDFAEFVPYQRVLRTADLVSVVRTSDFYSHSQLRKSRFYAVHSAPGNRHGIHVFFPTTPGHFRKLSLFRDSNPDFTERDRLALQLIRPHLYEIHLDAQRRRSTVPHLSRREWEVLRFAHEGRSNKAIAEELCISIATVRKHMEHIFDRTGTRTRTAASALMIPHLPSIPIRS